MFPLGQAQALAVLQQRRGVQVIQRKTREDALIGRQLVGVGQHPAHPGIAKPVVTLVPTAVGMPKRRHTHVHRALRPGGTRNTNHQQRSAVHFDRPHVAGLQQIDADPSAVVEPVPQRLLTTRQLLAIQSIQADPPVVLRRPQHDHASLRVRHRAVGFPEAARQPSLGRLELPVATFACLCRLQDAIDQVRVHRLNPAR